MTSQYKKIFSYTLKIAIVVFAFWFIYVKLTTNNDLKEFLVLMKQMPDYKIEMVLSLVGFLMLVNWGLEAIKWKRLISSIQDYIWSVEMSH